MRVLKTTLKTIIMYPGIPAAGAAAPPAAAAAAAPVGILTNQQADSLLQAAFRQWKQGVDSVTNSPRGCPQISRVTMNYLKGRWQTASAGGRGNGPNSSSQTSSSVVWDNNRVKKWVGGSVSGGSGTVDFHALWAENTNAKFLFHFRVVG